MDIEADPKLSLFKLLKSYRADFHLKDQFGEGGGQTVLEALYFAVCACRHRACDWSDEASILDTPPTLAQRDSDTFSLASGQEQRGLPTALPSLSVGLASWAEMTVMDQTLEHAEAPIEMFSLAGFQFLFEQGLKITKDMYEDSRFKWTPLSAGRWKKTEFYTSEAWDMVVREDESGTVGLGIV